MDATHPAARATLAVIELFDSAPDAALTGGHLLGFLDPADEFVACQRSDIVPGATGR